MYYYDRKTRIRVVVLEAYSNSAKGTTLIHKGRTNANIGIDVLRGLWRNSGYAKPDCSTDLQWNNGMPRCCVFVAPTRNVVEDHAKQSLMTQSSDAPRGGSRVDVWVDEGRGVLDALRKGKTVQLNTEPDDEYAVARLHHVVLESWNKEELRWICMSSTTNHYVGAEAVAFLVIDEARLPHVLINVMLIDLLSEDPRLGMSPCEYYNMTIYLAKGVGGRPHTYVGKEAYLYRGLSE